MENGANNEKRNKKSAHRCKKHAAKMIPVRELRKHIIARWNKRISSGQIIIPV